MAPDMAGKRQMGMITSIIALNALERAAGMLGGSASEEGREILEAVIKLRKRFGTAEPDLQQQQLKVLGAGIPAVQSPSPIQSDAFQSAIKQRQATQGLPAPAMA